METPRGDVQQYVNLSAICIYYNPFDRRAISPTQNILPPISRGLMPGNAKCKERSIRKSVFNNAVLKILHELGTRMIRSDFPQKSQRRLTLRFC